jgi:hypothetical protein
MPNFSVVNILFPWLIANQDENRFPVAGNFRLGATAAVAAGGFTSLTRAMLILPWGVT